jgi:hypothetical protein
VIKGGVQSNRHTAVVLFTTPVTAAAARSSIAADLIFEFV